MVVEVGHVPPTGPLHEQAVQPMGTATPLPPLSPGSSACQSASEQVGGLEPVSIATGPAHPMGTCTHCSEAPQPPLPELLLVLPLPVLPLLVPLLAVMLLVLPLLVAPPPELLPVLVE